MKEGWEYKKLGEVCTVLNGFAFKSGKYTDSGTRIMRITNVQKGFIVDDDPKYYPSKEMQGLNQYILKENDLLMSLTGNVGRVGLLQKELLPAALNQRVACLRIKDYSLSLRFLFHWLNSAVFEQDAIFSASGIAQKNLSTEWLKSYKIAIPPLSEQQHIVEELDLLSSIIEKKKAQLKELDNLAQSLFYEMFGDPISNEKGWEVKKLKDCCKNYDSQRKPITAKDRIKGSIPYYGASGVVDYVRDFIFDGDFLLVSEDGANLVLRSTPIAFCIKGKTWVNNHAHILKFDTLFQQKYIEFSINLRDISMMVTGCAQPKLTQAALNNMIILYPPLSLQQQFASKIEAIEHQKELIKQSIKEVETLFNSRMDYYFN